MDCCEQADLSVITHAMTDLAEFSLDIAFSEAQRQLAERHGTPQLVGDEQALLWIVGMGKLGARELNVSSDIDLIYVYDEDGETTGAVDASGVATGTGRISHQEYFAKIVKAMQAMIGEVTEHGCVFRVDLALRPNGNSGAVVLLRQAYPINVLGRIKECFEVCSIYCATANPVEVIVAQSEQGRGILGVIDGSSPKGVEDAAGIEWRHSLLRKIGYKR